MKDRPGMAFQVNDYIFHSSSGVCVVEAICKPNIRRTDPDRTYYRLHPIYEQGSVIYTPTDSDNPIVRPVMSREEAMDLIHKIPYIDTLWIENEKTREESYRRALRTNDFNDWMRVIKTLYLRNRNRKRNGKRTTAVDERFLQMAENLLYGELAVALDIPRDEVEAFVERQVLESEQHEERCS